MSTWRTHRWGLAVVLAVVSVGVCCSPAGQGEGEACRFAADCRDGALCLQSTCQQPVRGQTVDRHAGESPVAHQEESLEEKSRPGDDREVEADRAQLQQQLRGSTGDDSKAKKAAALIQDKAQGS